MSGPVAVVLLMVGAYLVGSIPFGLLVGRARGLDVRRLGSGNTGATNVGRVLGRRYGVLVFVLDVLKGLGPTLLAGRVFSELWAGWGLPEPMRYLCWLGVGGASIIGHNHPLYLRFRGGKGVSTSLGVVLGIYPELTSAALLALLVWVVVVAISRYVSLGSVCAGIALPLAFACVSAYRGDALLSDRWPLTLFTVLLTVMVFVRHWSNIGRLLAGTEAKIGRRPAVPPGPIRS